jgi:hypothetical protein
MAADALSNAATARDSYPCRELTILTGRQAVRTDEEDDERQNKE